MIAVRKDDSRQPFRQKANVNGSGCGSATGGDGSERKRSVTA